LRHALPHKTDPFSVPGGGVPSTRGSRSAGGPHDVLRFVQPHALTPPATVHRQPKVRHFRAALGLPPLPRGTSLVGQESPTTLLASAVGIQTRYRRTRR